MRTRFVLSAILVLLIGAVPGAQQPPDADPSQLPVRRVVLYKSGVGYFEHRGTVTGSANVAIQFTSGQLNDVLKSLTAIDLGNGRIASIGYNSVAPMEQRLGMLLLPLGANPDMLQFYTALRGARVEVRRGGGTAVTGQLLGIERKPVTQNGSVEQTDVIALVSTAGAVHTIVLGPDVTVRIAEQSLRDEVARYLGVIASGRDQDVRRMVLSATGDGTRQLMVSYVSEVPIWKSTYRLVLPDRTGDMPLLQGWAIVDNTVGEDWTDVELSLVAGAPQSFVQQVSQPYYARRPVVPLPQTVLFAPQTHEATLRAGTGTVRGVVRDGNGTPLPGTTVELADPSGRVVASAVSNPRGEYELHGAPGSYQLTMRLNGFQNASRSVSLSGGTVMTLEGRMNVRERSETVFTGEALRDLPTSRNLSSLMALAPGVDVSAAGARNSTGGVAGGVPGGVLGGGAGGAAGGGAGQGEAPTLQARMASVNAAAAQDLGDLFEYRLTEPVTIRTSQSALVPIVNAPVDASRVSLWNRGQGSGRPLRAVWLTNASGLTLDGGTFSVIDAGAFAGEGLIDPLKPGERRLISYGSDLAVLVDSRLDEASGRYVRVTARDGIVIAEQEDRHRWVYRVRNEDGSPRTLVIEHPVRAGWTRADDPAPAETTTSAVRYLLPVEPRAEAELVVDERRTTESRVTVGQMDDAVIASFAQRGVGAEALRTALQPVFDARAASAAAERQVTGLTSQITAIARDQERVRENMKALRGSREERALLQRYTRELGEQEDRLADLQVQLAAATAEREARQRDLARVVEELTFEIDGR